MNKPKFALFGPCDLGTMQELNTTHKFQKYEITVQFKLAQYVNKSKTVCIDNSINRQ